MRLLRSRHSFLLSLTPARMLLRILFITERTQSPNWSFPSRTHVLAQSGPSHRRCGAAGDMNESR